MLILPLLVAIAMAATVTTIHHRLPASIAARAVLASVVVVAAAAVPTLWILGLGYLIHLPFLMNTFGWCEQVFGVHNSLSPLIGLPAILAAGIGTVQAVCVLHTYRRLRHDGLAPIEIARHLQPFAFTLPGRGGHIVVSTGLVELLDEDERRVVLAHEGAHAQYRHDRYLLVAQLATAAMPMLRPLSSRLQFSLERWADETAAKECGDRHFVARTLGKVALHSVSPVGVLSFASLGVTARVAALLAPPNPTPRSSMLIGLWFAIAATGAFAGLQIHHLTSLVSALCHH